MGELSTAFEEIAITDFRYIRSLNTNGISKLRANLGALEQVLAMISPSGTSALNRVRTFYDLVQMGPDFIEKAMSMPYKFTMQQYRSIFDVYYRAPGSESAAAIKIYNNHLIRLKYLLEGTAES